MEKFPQAMYIAPGAEKLESGLFTTKLVNDEAERDAALAAGWHECQEDAQAAYLEKLEAERIAAKLAATQGGAGGSGDTGEQPTRAELEQKATELGIEYSPRIGDEKLAERIAAKLAEQPAT